MIEVLIETIPKEYQDRNRGMKIIAYIHENERFVTSFMRSSLVELMDVVKNEVACLL